MAACCHPSPACRFGATCGVASRNPAATCDHPGAVNPTRINSSLASMLSSRAAATAKDIQKPAPWRPVSSGWGEGRVQSGEHLSRWSSSVMLLATYYRMCAGCVVAKQFVKSCLLVRSVGCNISSLVSVRDLLSSQRRILENAVPSTGVPLQMPRQ